MKKYLFLYIIILLLLAFAGGTYIIVAKRNQQKNAKQVSDISKEQEKLDSSIFTEAEKADAEFLKKLPVKPQTKDSVRVPILLYHNIGKTSDSAKKSYFVTPENFRRQIKWLSDNGYQVITLKSLVNYLKTGQEKPRDKSIIITFDDGTLGQYTGAYPILKEFNYTATFFVVPKFIDEQGKNGKEYINWTELKELNDNGMEIASHSYSHVELAKETNQSVDFQLKESKKVLEDKLGITISNFAYPGGSMTKYDWGAVEANKYDSASSVEKRIDHKASELYHLGRMHIDDDLPFFIARVEGRWFK